MERAPADPDPCYERRWAAALAHRPRLLRLAISRTPTLDDAEDVVQEAILRCVLFENLDEERLDRMLTTVTLRLCVDEHRRRTQSARLHRRLGAEPVAAPGVDERVCDRAEAAWVANLVERLPAQQQRVLAAKAEGMSCGEIGAGHRMSYKAVESALRHARTTLRRALAATACVALGALAHLAAEPIGEREAQGPAPVAVGPPGWVLREPADRTDRTAVPAEASGEPSAESDARAAVPPSGTDARDNPAMSVSPPDSIPPVSVKPTCPRSETHALGAADSWDPNCIDPDNIDVDRILVVPAPSTPAAPSTPSAPRREVKLGPKSAAEGVEGLLGVDEGLEGSQ